ncbi:hypothetical protein EPO34_02555 [Patescibacteria group bacterium]|nr:MAG: hypothetical protein EPO34_02555 [Patescibacteria group bacterium]
MDEALHKAILRTLAWFSLFDYAPTAFETWKWLFVTGEKPSLDEVDAALRGGGYPSKDGFHALPGTDAVALARTRHARRRDALRKMRALRRAVRFLRRVPGVRAVAAANTLAFMHTRPESDIDLFVRTMPGLTWTARLMCVTPFAILRQRPEDGARDPFCFSFFASTAAPALETLALPGGDPYLEVWIRSLRTVYGDVRSQDPTPGVGNSSFCKKPGDFENRDLENPGFPKETTRPTPGVGRGGHVERLARWIQLRRLPHSLRTLMNRDSRVVVNDEMLKFHENDRRAEYRDRWMALCRTYAYDA